MPVAPQAYPVGAPAPYYGTAPSRSAALGVVAFVAALVAFILSPIVSGITGSTLGTTLPVGAGFSGGFQAGADNPHAVVTGLLIVAQLVIGSGLGIWAIVQGIIAIRSRRGRGWGIVAIVLAAVAPILSFIVYTAAIAVAQSAG